MIKTLIFDFGNVFINLDTVGAMKNALELFKVDTLSEEMLETNTKYEKGLISTKEFIDFYLYGYPHTSENDIIESWNYIIEDLPESRISFLRKLKKEGKYKLILLSNTNHMHMEWVKMNVRNFDEFYDYFDRFYLSHELKMRKPEVAIYKHVLNNDNLKPAECLFIDDAYENINNAKILGINTWHLNPEEDDVTELFEKNAELF